MAENLPVRDLQLEDQLQLLNAIDSVRSQGLGVLVNLPQLGMSRHFLLPL